MSWEKRLQQLFHQDKNGYTETVCPQEHEISKFIKELLRNEKLRAAADLDNARKRAGKDVQEAISKGKSSIIRELLEIADDFDRIMKFQNASEKSLVEGTKMINDKLHALFARHGVKKIDALHLDYNPCLHEAILHIPNDKYPNMVIVEEVKTGYKLYDKVLRASSVVVSSGKSNPDYEE